MKTAIVDTQVTGHHLEYIYGLLAESGKTDSNEGVDIFCDSHLREYIRENKLEVAPDEPAVNLKVNVLANPVGGWFKTTVAALKNLWALKDYDNLIFLSLNVYLPALFIYALVLKPSFIVSGIFFNPHVRKEKDWKNWIRDITFRYILKRFKGCAFFILNDEEAAIALNSRYTTSAFQVICDPIPGFYYKTGLVDSYRARGKFTFTMIGSISLRKGVFEFLSAIRMTRNGSRFVLAGKIDERISTEVIQNIDSLRKSGYLVEIYNRFITNREFAEFVSEADVLVMPYLSKGASSGILGHAAFTKKTVIGPNQGILSDLIRDYELGFTIDPRDTVAFANLIETLSAKTSVPAGRRAQEYVELNSLAKFYSKLIRADKDSDGASLAVERQTL